MNQKLKGNGILIFFLFCLTPASGSIKIHVIDVGYGTAVHVETPTQNFLFDAGPQEKSSKILKSLANQKVVRLNAVFISHNYPDHIGSLEKILSQIPVNYLFWPKNIPLTEDLNKLRLKRGDFPEIRYLEEGDKMIIERDLSISVLNSNLGKGDPNDNCLAFGLAIKKMKLLLAGDMGPLRQNEIIQIESAWLRDSKFLLWPHHGEKLETEFAKGIKNRPICVVSVGENPYGLPSQTIKQDAESFCAALYRTDTMSDLDFIVDGSKISRDVGEHLKE